MRIERVVDAYLRHVTVERGLSAHTTAAYRRDLEDYRRWLHGEGVDDIEAVTPSVLVKGEDWAHYVSGREVVEKNGGRVVLAPLVKGRSTSDLIRKILEAYQPGK